MPTNNKTQKESNMLKEILSISGKPGLFKLINNTANALIVESLLDGKRFPAYSNAKIIALEDISIYTEDEDMPLKTVFKRMYEKEEGKPAINHKESSAVITNYIESVIPEYDADRVYVSDMRKMIQWYNLLLDKNLLNFDEPEEEKKEEYLSRLGFEIEDRMVIYNDKSIALLNKLLTDKYPSIDIYSINLTTSALNGVPVIQDVVVFLRDLDNLTETASPIN